MKKSEKKDQERNWQVLKSGWALGQCHKTVYLKSGKKKKKRESAVGASLQGNMYIVCLLEFVSHKERKKYAGVKTGLSDQDRILLLWTPGLLRLQQESVTLRLGQSCLCKELCEVWKKYEGKSFGLESQRTKWLEGNAQGVPEDKLAPTVLSASP